MGVASKIVSGIVALGALAVAFGYYNQRMYPFAIGLGIFGLLMIYVTTKV